MRLLDDAAARARQPDLGIQAPAAVDVRDVVRQPEDAEAVRVVLREQAAGAEYATPHHALRARQS